MDKLFIGSKFFKMGDRLPIIDAEYSPPENPPTYMPAMNSPSGFNYNTPARYEELLDGVPCPSCNGSGRIPKELERQLVALIPLTDNRLKPRRTWIWVISAVLICLVVSSLLLFFLIPRSVTLSSNDPPVTSISVVTYQKGSKITISFLNAVNVSNENFFSVYIVNATSTVAKIVYPDTHEVIGKGFNNSGLTVPMKVSGVSLLLNHTVTITDWALAMCELPYGYVRLYFAFTVTFEYFNHREQETYDSSQLVCCTPSGNCTQSYVLSYVNLNGGK